MSIPRKSKMFVEYQELPPTSRIWIYESARVFTSEEKRVISSKTKEFIEQWTRHGDDLKGSFTIKYDRFLIIAVDSDFTPVSGCSIDASVHFIQELEKAFHLDLLDKLHICFKEGNTVKRVAVSDFQHLVRNKEVTEKTIVFNHMVQTKEALETTWEVPVSQSWHKRFLASF